MPKRLCKLFDRTVLWKQIHRNRRNDRFRQGSATGFSCSGADGNFYGQSLKTSHDRSGARTKLVLWNLQKRQGRNFARYVIQVKIYGRLQGGKCKLIATQRAEDWLALERIDQSFLSGNDSRLRPAK